MENSTYGSNRFNELRNKVLVLDEDEQGADNVNLLRKECEDYIRGLLIDGMNSYNTFYQGYCSYALALGLNFVSESSHIMFVRLREEGTSLNINAIDTIRCVESELEILFIVAHEVKHLINRHLLKYGYMFSDDVTHVFLNLATDVEVNEGLKRELGKWGSTELSINTLRTYIPSYCFDLKAMADLLGEDNKALQKRFNSWRYGKDAKTPADNLYILLSKKCEKVLGYSIPNILYRIMLAKNTSFSDEVFRVADGGDSNIFTITDKSEARRFCRAIARYLQRSLTVVIVCSGGMKSSLSCGAEGGTLSSGSGSGEDGNSGGNSEGSGKGNNRGIKDYKSARNEYISEGLTPYGIEELLKGVEELSKSYLESAGFRSRGLGGSGVSKVDLKKFEPKLTWKNVLLRKMNTLSDDKEYTKKRINRRQPCRLELSGKKRKHCITLAVCLDVSGSISDLEYSYFLSELFNIVKNFECEIHLYEFTSKVNSYTYFPKEKAKKELKFTNSKFGIRFTGGTSFQPVFDALSDNTKFDSSEGLAIFFTDGCGEESVNFRNIKNRMWVLVPDGEEYKLSCGDSESNIFPIVDVYQEV